MKMTFEELVEEYSFQDNNEILMFGENCLELMKLVREATLVEASNKAKADFEIINTSERAELFRVDNIEPFVVGSSILGLDKDSIEI